MEWFEVADKIIGEAYPDIHNKGVGWWGAKRIPNHGILRGGIARELQAAFDNGATNQAIGLSMAENSLDCAGSQRGMGMRTLPPKTL